MANPLLYCIIPLLVTLSHCQSLQKFMYTTNQTLIIQRLTFIELDLALTTQADEYLSQATILTNIQFNQSTSLYYHILYFNYGTEQGQECYQNWVVNNLPVQQVTCEGYDFDQGIQGNCLNFTACFNESISFSLALSQEEYKQSLIMIQNPSNDTDLILQAEMQMQLSSENLWFYWGVGLTCLLLISLVIYAGIIFYWLLKYKRVKKMFEQFKLTEEEESIKKEN